MKLLRRLRAWGAERRRLRQRRDVRTRLLMAWVRIAELRYQLGIERQRDTDLLLRIGRDSRDKDELREIAAGAALLSGAGRPRDALDRGFGGIDGSGP